MTPITERLAQSSLRLLYACQDRAWLTIAITIFAVLAAAAGATRLTTTNDLRVYFSDDNPELVAFESLEEKYGNHENIVFVIIPTGPSIFNQADLELVRNLTNSAWLLPHVSRVQSLANFQFSRADGDQLITEPLLGPPGNEVPAPVAALRVASEPGIQDRLVASDGSLALISVSLTLPRADASSASETSLAAARELAAPWANQILLAGSVTNSVMLGEAVESDIQRLVLLSFGIIVILLLGLLRSVFATILVVLIIGASVLTTMGIFGWLGYELGPTAGFVPSVVMTIAVADCVHVLVSYFVELGQGRSKFQAIRESLRINQGPIFLTSVTTALGLASLNLSDSPPYRDLGTMVATGVIVALVLSLTLLPAALSILPAPKQSATAFRQLSLAGLANWVIRHQGRALTIGGLAVVGIAAFIPRNELTERWHEYFSEGFEIRQAMDTISDRMGSVHYLNYDLETNQTDGITDPEFMHAMDAFANWLESQKEVVVTNGLHSTIKRLNQLLNEDDPQAYEIPETSAAISQYLLLYELGLPPGEGIRNLVDEDRSASSFMVSTRRMDSEGLLAFDARAQDWLEANTPLATEGGTGLDLIFAHITHRNIRGILTGTAWALVAISILLAIVFGSIKMGLISLLPNLAPAALAYGAWGMTFGYIDLGLSVVICMSLGIVVDDTVHFLSKYRRARRERGLSSAEGVRYAFRTVGMALVTTSIVLVVGFLVLQLSEFNPTRGTGLLMSLTLAFALVVDFLLLPPLLLRLDGGGIAPVRG